MARVTMYTKQGCPYCAAARDHYTKAGLAFDDINVIGDKQAQEELLRLSRGQRIVPVIVDDGKVTIGWDGG